MKKIAIMFGGVSLEHEVSIITALQVFDNIDKSKYDAFAIYIDKKGQWWTGKDLEKKEFYSEGKNSNAKDYLDEFSLTFGFNKNDIEAAILCFHGGIGEGGGIQGALEAANIPFQGPNTTSSAVSLDKIFTRQILKSENISQPAFGWFNHNQYQNEKNSVLEKIKEVGYPIYLKVTNSGSSIGVKKIKSEKEIDKATKELFLYGDRCIFEKEVTDCIEVNISLFGDQDKIEVSTSEQPIKSDELLSFDDKYTKGGKKSGMASVNRRMPAPISFSSEDKLKKVAKEIFKILNLEGVIRIDFFVNPSTDEYYVIEVNTIPGSLSFYLWEANNKSFKQLIDDLINLAEKRAKRSEKLVTTFSNNLLSKIK